METLTNWWNSIVGYFKTLDEEPTKQTIVAVEKPAKKKAKKATKAVVAETIKASKAIKMITDSINTETDSGKKKYKSRLSRELNKAITDKDKVEMAKSIQRIVKYLEK